MTATTKPLGTQTYATYLDMTNQVVPWLRMYTITISLQDQTNLSLIVDSVCTEAQRFIGGPIAPTLYGPTTGIGMFDGAGGLMSGYIMLPKFPVISITKVIEHQAQGSAVTLVEVPNTTGTTGTGFQVNYRTGRLTRVLGGQWNRPWYPGSNNIWVTWTAGYNPIPADIVRASLEWVAHIYRNTQQSRGGGVRGIASGEYEPATATTGLWAGIPNRVRETLKSYIHVGVR